MLLDQRLIRTKPTGFRVHVMQSVTILTGLSLEKRVPVRVSIACSGARTQLVTWHAR